MIWSYGDILRVNRMSLNPLISWIPSLLLILSLLFLLTKRSRKARAWNLPPGPTQLPIIGNLHQLGTFSHRSFLQLSKKYGPLMYLQLGYVPTVIVSSARMAKEVMKTQDLDFCSRPQYVSFKKVSYNYSGVATAPYSDYWREMRKICVTELLSTKRVQSFGSIREEEVWKMIKVISNSPSEIVNLSKMLAYLTNTIISRAAFGMSCVGSRQQSSYHEVLQETQGMATSFFFANFIPWMAWMDTVTGMNARMEKIFQKLNSIYEEVIEEHINTEGPRPEQEDFADVLLRVKKDHNLTSDHIKAVLADIFGAGTDTSSTTLVWAMTELIRNPRVMKKAQDEVRMVVGKKGKVEESDLPQLQYISMVVKETLRLHPPAPLLLPRETMRHCRIDGYDILPKTNVIINSMAIAQDPECWESPDEFLPERFEDGLIDYRGHNFEYTPFGAGRRICPGMSFAIVTVELALANLLYSYDWKLPAGMNEQQLDMSETSGIVVSKKSALLLVPINYINSTTG